MAPFAHFPTELLFPVYMQPLVNVLPTPFSAHRFCHAPSSALAVRCPRPSPLPHPFALCSHCLPFPYCLRSHRLPFPYHLVLCVSSPYVPGHLLLQCRILRPSKQHDRHKDACHPCPNFYWFSAVPSFAPQSDHAAIATCVVTFTNIFISLAAFLSSGFCFLQTFSATLLAVALASRRRFRERFPLQK